MESNEQTIEILKDIRDEVRRTNSRLDQTNARLYQTHERVETSLADVSRRMVDSEIRTSAAVAKLAGTVREMTSVLRVRNDLRPRVERCEQHIAALQRKVGEG
jgi:hypothetical protein